MGFFDRFKSKKERELGATAGSASTTPEKVKAEVKELKAAEKAKKEEPLIATERVSMEAAKVLYAPVVTEKSARAANDSKYTFAVPRTATKVDVSHAVEKAYKVTVTKVNTQRVRGKIVRFGRSLGQEKSWKKAIVTLKAGEKLDVYEGLK